MSNLLAPSHTDYLLLGLMIECAAKPDRDVIGTLKSFPPLLEKNGSLLHEAVWKERGKFPF